MISKDIKDLTIKEIKEIFETIDSLSDPFYLEATKDNRAGVKKLVESKEKQIIKSEKAYNDYLARLEYENKAKEKGYKFVVGIDEVGRGPLAGPVVAACVILPEDTSNWVMIKDSKTINTTKREQLVDIIKKEAYDWSISEVSASRIDKVNILQATKEAMLDAITKLSVTPDYLLLDAISLPTDIKQESIIKGDQKSLSIAAASLLAKDYRDKLMIEYSHKYPQYDFDTNVGYGTKKHLDALEKYGPCHIHRKTFEPVKSLM